jgi:hypothetical protein
MQPTATHGNQIADLVTSDSIADLLHIAHDLVPWHDRKNGARKMAARVADIGVADTAVAHLEQHIVRSGLATLDRKRRQRRGCRFCCVGFGRKHTGVDS